MPLANLPARFYIVSEPQWYGRSPEAPMNPLVQFLEHKVVGIVRGAALWSLLRIVQALHTGGIRLMAWD